MPQSVGGRPIRLCLQTGEPLATPCRLGDPERPMSSQRSMAPSLREDCFFR